MTTYAKKATFRRTPPYSWDASAPEIVAVGLKVRRPCRPYTIDQILRFSLGLVLAIRQVRRVRLVGQVFGKALVSGFFVR